MPGIEEEVVQQAGRAEAGAGTGDMSPEEFRRFGYAVIDWIASYLEDPTRWRVTPATEPGAVRDALPPSPPDEPESMSDVLEDFERLIVPATTHWNHPRFFGYFPSTGSGPGILAEALAAALNVNAMLWRTAPAATELEQHTVDWLRQLLGLPTTFRGVITDTASVSTLYALAAAREANAELRVRQDGLPGRAEIPRLRIYASEEAHSSVEKAAVTLGLGQSGLRRIPTDERFRMDPEALAAAIREDRANGILPIAVVATIATTATTAVDPVPAIADVCEREGLWLHVDAAYGGAAAVLPEMRWIFEGCDRADSLVVNPHKWFFVPVDCSALFIRRPEVLRRAFSIVPDYLTTAEDDRATNLMDYGVSLGRRFRALKLWFTLRYFGASGIADRIREHLRLARLFASWVDEHPEFERIAPVDFTLILFRHRPPQLTASRNGAAAGSDDQAAVEAALAEHNARLLEQINATGEVFLSHTRASGRYALRLAIGNLRTTEQHLAYTWELVRRIAGAT
ncbi:MAG TPA: pyridoxal-dependent decarboxylase [Longimicrobiales bacterium]|nr:pyridoxal-dependent decarboxylase [Longimicrobiales bacterium]